MATIIDKVTLTDGTYMEIVDIETAGQQITFAYHQLEIVLADASAFSVGGAITGDGTAGNDGVGTIRQITDNTVVVELTSGTFVVGNGVDNANPYNASETTISSVANNFKVLRTSAADPDTVVGQYL